MNSKMLKNLLADLDYNIITNEKKVLDTEILNISYDTRNISKDDIFICIKGSKFDAHDQIDEILNKNPRVIVVEKKIENRFLDKANSKNIIVITVSDTRQALAIISRNFFENKFINEKVKIVGITGTKGKTTTSFMIKSILEEKGFKVGLIGTIGIFYNDKYIETNNTTPESFLIHKTFKDMRDDNVDFIIMEVSSQSLKYSRVYGIKFDYAIFTNIDLDHISEFEHSDFNDYLKSKLKIFEQSNFALINYKTKNLDDIIKKVDDAKIKKRFFLQDEDLISNINLINTKKNLGIEFNYKGNKYEINLIGIHNIHNAICAIEFASILNIDYKCVYDGLSKVKVFGRAEVCFKNEDFCVIVDYAHNGMGTEAIIKTIKDYNPKRIVTVFGCGGNRTKDRRYEMGKVSGKLADFSIITSDNSRYENVDDIINDILSTLKKETNNYIVIKSRKEAIKYAIENHQKGDCILLLGKGHENYNEENGIKTHFNDKEEVLNIINE